MPSTYSDLKLQLMATGENDTTWGVVTNANIDALEQALVGSSDIVFASANQTLTLTDSNAPQDARSLRLNLTGVTGGATRELIVPAIQKLYIVSNGCADSVTVKNATGTGVTVPPGTAAILYNDATNVVAGMTFTTSLSVSTPIAVASGGTGGGTQSAARVGIGAAKSGANTDITSLQTLNYAVEKVTVSATAATGTITLDAMTQSVLYYTTAASANWTFNIRGDGSTTLNSLMAVGDSLTVVFMNTNGATARYNSLVQIDGSIVGVTALWQGGAPPATGNANDVDVYSYTVIKTASATFTVLASQTRFG